MKTMLRALFRVVLEMLLAPVLLMACSVMIILYEAVSGLTPEGGMEARKADWMLS